MAAYTTIDNPELYFQTYIYAGNASNPRTHTLSGDEDMQPDMIFQKNRSSSNGWTVADAVRGANLTLSCDGAGAEITDKADGHVDSFTSTGFVLGAGTSDARINDSGNNYAAWCWKESATAGFDIISYSGTGSAKTESHSLSAVPHWMLVKQRNDPGGGSNSWEVYHQKNTSAPETEFMYFNETGATTDSNLRWNDTAPTSSVITVGTGYSTNQSSSSFIGYLWSEKQGYSKFGSYSGNGNADGTFVYTGFRPAFLIIKRTEEAGSWNLIDTKRDTYNPTAVNIKADSSNAEESFSICDILSNGFKIRTTNGAVNNSSGTYIYMAFAEAPFVNSNGVPCNAR